MAASFPERARIDARDKVTGATRYAADMAFPGLLHAMLVPATIARGRVVSLATAAAVAAPGVVRILTANDFVAAKSEDAKPTITDAITYRGQPVALVVAETLEAAIAGAELVSARYAATPNFAARIDSEGRQVEAAPGVSAGDADAAMARATVRHAAEYVSPAQHHNPMELLSTTALWANGELVIHEGTQASNGIKAGVTATLGLDAARVRAVSPQLGGGFGQRDGAQRQTAIVAHAAMLLGRPVKLVVPRGQIFHNAKFRALSRHRVEIGADAAGRMVAARYDLDQQQSRGGDFRPEYFEAPAQMYGIADYKGTAANIRIDTQDPGHMRSPQPHPGCFAFESAVDELAEKLGRDPVAFRLRHRATMDPLEKLPLSSCFLHECIVEGARRFDWRRRTPTPGSMTLADGTLVGLGIGCGAYPAHQRTPAATLRVTADGRTRFATGGHEMGQGMRTAIAQVLLAELPIDPEGLEILIGDTAVATQQTTGGSSGTASATSAALAAATKRRAAVIELTGERQGSFHRRLAAVKRPYVQVEAERETGGHAAFSSYSYIAHFAEVHIEPRTRRVRVPRVVSIADCGRVVSPRTAASQMHGAVIWAIGAALREESEVDPRYGGWLNADLADYVVPVNADIGEIEVGFIDRPDPHLNTLGVKGLGEVAMTGAAAAIANAIHHATGRRLRAMPFRVEDLL